MKPPPIIKKFKIVLIGILILVNLLSIVHTLLASTMLIDIKIVNTKIDHRYYLDP
jgi:hypothetical protein